MRATNLSVAHAYCHVLPSVNKVNEMKGYIMSLTRTWCHKNICISTLVPVEFHGRHFYWCQCKSSLSSPIDLQELSPAAGGKIKNN